MPRKLFSLQEANHLIPHMESELKSIHWYRRDFKILHNEWKSLHTFFNHEQHSPLNERIFLIEAKLEFLHHLAEQGIENIHRQGALILDVDRGLVDFPGLLEDEIVYFCWQKGETAVMYYHFINESYSKRRMVQ